MVGFQNKTRLAEQKQLKRKYWLQYNAKMQHKAQHSNYRIDSQYKKQGKQLFYTVRFPVTLF